jgi:hypothetical protein
MNSDLEQSDLSTVLAEGRVVADETRRTFGHLSAWQVNWKPSAEDWSIGQCFEHLILSNAPYFEIVQGVLDGRRPGVWERLPLLSRMFGKLVIRTLRPDSGREAKARPAFLPSSSAIARDIVKSFLEQQNRLLDLMESTRRLDLSDIIVRSPVIRFVTYSLMDGYRIIVVHEQNHLVQARRVMESPGFPR